MSASILAIIPAFNEEAGIAAIVGRVRALGYEVLVVDDGSADQTADRARDAGAKVLQLPINLGYGGALQTGYLYAHQRGVDIVVQLDADGQHDVASLEALVRPVLDDEADVVIGSRFLGAGDYRMPLARRLGQRLFGGIAAMVTGHRVTDPTSGLQALRGSVVAVYCTRLFPDDYPDADMHITLHRLGFRVREVPAIMHASAGASMHSGVLRPLYYVYKMSLAMLAATLRRLPARPK